MLFGCALGQRHAYLYGVGVTRVRGGNASAASLFWGSLTPNRREGGIGDVMPAAGKEEVGRHRWGARVLTMVLSLRLQLRGVDSRCGVLIKNPIHCCEEVGRHRWGAAQWTVHRHLLIKNRSEIFSSNVLSQKDLAQLHESTAIVSFLHARSPRLRHRRHPATHPPPSTQDFFSH